MNRHVLGCMCQPTLSPCARCVRAGCWCLDHFQTDNRNRDALIRHISDLESVIRKRNQTVAALESELAGLRKWHDKWERRVEPSDAAIQRVRDLHKKSECDKKYCRGGNCTETCEACDQDYPCPTIEALGGAQE